MKTPELTSGIITLAVGLFGVFFGFLYISSLQSYNVYGLPISEFIRTMDASVNQQYLTAQILLYGGGITAIFGLILAIYGFMAESDKERKAKIIQKEPEERRCNHCGRIIPIDSKVCPYCSIEFGKVAEKEDNLSSTEILKQRYAKGEITEEEYEKMKNKLED